MREKRFFVLVPLMLCLAATGAFAQAGSGGALEGRVVDNNGDGLPGVTVTITNRDTGLLRSVMTAADGSFRVPSLPVGLYDVGFELTGFTSVTVAEVRVTVGGERGLAVTMGLASVEEAITVTDAAPLAATSPVIGTVISQQELENLPLNGRQFASLGTLAAGTTLGFNPDPTKPGQQVIALNGGIGRNVNYMVDGGDNMDDTIGGALQNFTIESVAEFSIMTQQYKAEYGRSTGGVLTVVTKSGTNQFDGSVFGFFRDDSLNSKTETEKQTGADKQQFSRDQLGFTIGGPLRRDKAHFFAAYERTERDTNITANTGGLFPELDGSSVPVPFTDDLISVKLTGNLSPKQALQVRYGYQKNEDKYNAIPTATPDNFGTLTNEATTILFGLNSQVGSDSFNELAAQWSEFDNVISSDSTNPTIYFPSGVVTGQNPNTPQGTSQEKRQIRDDFNFSRTLGGDRHDFKIGLEYIDEPLLGGDFPSGLNGLFTAADDRRDSPITAITFFAGSFNFSTPNEQYRVYFQDDWQLNDRLLLNLGLRYDYTDLLELDQRSNSIWQTLSTQTTYNEFYLRDFQGGQGGVIDADSDDFAPRLGFTWDLTGDGDQLLRGGWGVYYDFPYSNATVLFPTAAVISQFGVVYQHNNAAGIRNPDGSFYKPGDPLPPNQVVGGGLAPAPNEVASPTLQTPKANQWSLGYSNQINNWLGFNAELVSIRYRDLPFRFRANPINPATGARRFPNFGNFRIWSGEGEANYDGVNLTLRGRASEKFEFQAFYTYSEADGNILAGADEFRLTDTGHQPELGGSRRDASVDPLNPLCGKCFGPLNTDAKSRFTLAGIYRAPYGVVVSGVLRFRSALPYTIHTGTDVNGDGFALDLPADVPNVNSARGSSFSQFDVRVAKEFQLAGDFSVELIGEVFNFFNDENPAGFVGARNAANFGQPTTFAGDSLQGEQRLAQLGLRLRF